MVPGLIGPQVGDLAAYGIICCFTADIWHGNHWNLRTSDISGGLLNHVQPCSTIFPVMISAVLYEWLNHQSVYSLVAGKIPAEDSRETSQFHPISASSHPPFEENNYTSWYTTQNLKHCHFQEKLYIRLKEGPKNHPKHSKTRLCCTMLWCLRHGFLGSAPLSGNLIYYSICPFLSIKYPWTISW